MVGDVVRAGARRIDEAGDRRGVHDMALIARHEARQEAAYTVDHAPEIDAENPLPVAYARLPRRAERRDARVVAHQMRAAQLGIDLLRERFHFQRFGHIQLHRQRIDAPALYRGEHFVQVADVAEGDVHAFIGEGERHRAAEAARRAGDGGHFSLELLHRLSSQSADSRHRLSRKRSRKKPKWPMLFTPSSRGATLRVSHREFGYSAPSASTARKGANRSSLIA